MSLRDTLLGPRPAAAGQTPPVPAAFAGDQANAQALDPPTANPLEPRLARLEQHLERLVALTSAQMTANRVLFSGTVLVDAYGYHHKQFPITYASVMVDNSDGAVDVVVTSSPPMASAPTLGAGVWIIPAGACRTVPLVGRDLTVYGTAGQTIGLVVSKRPVDPAGTVGTPGSAPLTSPLVVPNPAVGANWSYTTTFDMVLYAVSATVATGATAPSSLYILEVGASNVQCALASTAAANTTYPILWSNRDQAASLFAGPAPFPLPLAKGSVIEVAGGVSPTQQWSNINIFCVPWGG